MNARALFIGGASLATVVVATMGFLLLSGERERRETRGTSVAPEFSVRCEIGADCPVEDPERSKAKEGAPAAEAARSLTVAEKEKVAGAMLKFRAAVQTVEDARIERWRNTDLSGIPQPTVEDFARVSEGLSEALREFEPGSPPWKEMRRQGEALLRRLGDNRGLESISR
jgi:hypothetical protein